MKNCETPDNSLWKKRGLWLAKMALAILLALNSTDAHTGDKSNNITEDTKQKIEQAISQDILSKIQQRTWAELPDWYEEKVRNFASQSILLKDEEISKITEDFIVERIWKNPWINQKNWNVFVITCLFQHISLEDIYDLEDWDKEREQEFKKVIPILRDLSQEYEDRVVQRIVTLLYIKLSELEDFYISYKNHPQNVNQVDIDWARKLLRDLIPFCNAFGVDYTKKLSTTNWFYY